MKSYHWQAKTEYVPHDFNVQPTTILCASWRIPGKKKVESVGVNDFHKRLTYRSVRKDKQVVKTLQELLTWCADENIIVVYQNGNRFDLPKIKNRVVYHRLPSIPKLTTIDTLQQARKLGFDYNRLDYLDRFLHGHDAGKIVTRGWRMWKDAVEEYTTHEERLQALKEMRHYCDGDIVSLDRVFYSLLPYMEGLPNANLWQGTTDCCPHCGSDDVIYRTKPKYTKTRAYRRMSCNDCGRWFQESKAIPEYKAEVAAL